MLVPAFDTGAFAGALRSLLDDPVRARSMGACGQALIEEQCSFRGYLFDLLDMLGLKLPRVSVIVPNYNYARYLPERIGSITRQQFPFYELLVLDDASTDDSVQVIEQLAVELRVHLRIVRNERNSGSVFEQWAKGVAMARGDLVWIAEADDLAEPSFLKAVLAPMADPAVVMGYCQSRQIDTDGRQLAASYLDYTKDVSEERWLRPYRVDGLDEIRTCMAVKNTIPNVSAVVFRRTALADALDRLLTELRTYRIAGDWLTYLAVLERGDVAFVPESLNLHRRHASSVTIGSDRRPHMLEVLRVQRLVQQRYSPPAESVRKASKYARQLYQYFKLSNVEIEEIEALLANEVSLQLRHTIAEA
ncbi:MAG: glycosyltransferase [Ferrovum sp.]|nr:glycosyltransferase [Ferrovum sp.]